MSFSKNEILIYHHHPLAERANWSIALHCKGASMVDRMGHGFAEDVGQLWLVVGSCFHFFSSYDCSNLIFGQTVHPLDHTKSPGGSSGGDCALIKSGGSLLGIGTDVGGSIRIPAAFCGICGFKTTGNRIRYCALLGIFLNKMLGISYSGRNPINDVALMRPFVWFFFSTVKRELYPASMDRNQVGYIICLNRVGCQVEYRTLHCTCFLGWNSLCGSLCGYS